MTKCQFRRLPVRIRFVLWLGCAVLLFGAPLFSQIQTGRILGTVTDKSGGVVVNATVVVTNVQTGVARTLSTNAAGVYVAPNLNPGTYSVRVTAMGFQAFQRQNIPVVTGKDSGVNVVLTPGNVTQTIEVTEQAPLLDTTSAVVSGTVETQTISDLPIEGRNYQNLLNYRPGVTVKPGGGTLTQSTNGLRPSDNNYFVEGVDVTEPFTGQSIMNLSLPFGDAATFLPVDAIQEVNVETNPTAEFGRRPGAVVNSSIKSGTNSIHGSAFAFGRDDALDAKDYFVDTKAPSDLEQWGGSVGGPIIKDKLFYFGSFERQTYTVGFNYPTLTPSTNVANTDPNQSIPAAEAALASECLANSSLPYCTGAGGTYQRNALSDKILPLWAPTSGVDILQHYGFPSSVKIYNVVAKADYHFSDHHAFSGSFYRGDGSSAGEDTIVTSPSFISLGKLLSEFVTATWTWTPNSSWVNDLRFGWTTVHRAVVPNDSTNSASSYGINTGVTNPVLGGFPTVYVGGQFTQIGADENTPKNLGPSPSYDIEDHVSYLHGNHAFKFGADIMFVRPVYANYNAGRGVISFEGNAAFPGSTPLEDFLAGMPDNSGSPQSYILNGDPTRNFRQDNYAVFFEDTWHVQRNVTLNLGLRYEYFTPLGESRNRVGGWNPVVGLQQVGVNMSTAYPAYKKDFSPRFGFAWDIGGRGKTVLRGGAGIYYESPTASTLTDNIALPGKPSGIQSVPTGYNTGADGTAPPLLPVSSGGIGSVPISYAGSTLNWTLNGSTPVFPTPTASQTALACGNGLGGNPSPCNIFVMGSHFRPPRIEMWNVGIQRTLSNNLALDVNYVGNHSGDLWGVQDVNAIDPTNPLENGIGAGSCNHCESITHRPYYASFPYLQYINVLSNIDRSNYNALQTTLTGRNYHGLDFVAAYTWSHALDDYTQNRNINVPWNNNNPGLLYGPSAYDHAHQFSLTFSYAIPGKKGFGQLLEGWRINSAILFMSPFPYDVADNHYDISKVGDKKNDRWDFFGNPSDFKGIKGAPIPFYKGTVGGVLNPNMPQTCINAALTAGTFGTNGADGNLGKYGCYANGNSAMIAPPTGTFGNMGRNMFRGFDFTNVDASLFKNMVIKERLTAQFRIEAFNLFNIPNMSLPSGRPSNPGQFGCGCNTPDQDAQNPILGSGGARSLQLGLKLIF
jgi:Carboxypeptidase regulatory-like domain/TonB dependent receptor-like, beta-barrel